MKLWFTGDAKQWTAALEALCPELGFSIAPDGMPVELCAQAGDLCVSRFAGGARIRFAQPCHLFRGLMLLKRLLADAPEGAREVHETPAIPRVGLMLDVSRNAALSVDSLRCFIRRMALAGMNVLMLYMEDMYETPERPYFGYMRGRYSQAELRAVDDYAAMFGIEVVPYLQTLAHMTEALKWRAMANLRDTGDILLVDDDETYRFLEEILRAATAPLRSRRVHIGMDEAHDLGLGRHLELHGYQEKRELMKRHLDRVLAITDKLGLRAMIASDMLFTGAAADHYELGDDDACPFELPEQVSLMYWDYYHTDVPEIEAFIRRHQQWGKNPMYLGTVRTWESYATSYSQSFTSIAAALAACRNCGVEEAVLSVWMNDGAENSHFAALPGITYFAEQAYNPSCSREELRRRFAAQTGAELDAFLLLEKLDEIPGDGAPAAERGNPSHYLLWQDALLGLFDAHVQGLEAGAHYAQLGEALASAAASAAPHEDLFAMMAQLCRVLSRKAELGVRIKRAYDANDRGGLAQIAEHELPELAAEAEALRCAHRALWMRTLKPFGWEILDVRYGGLCARLDTASQRLAAYAAGEVDALEELEISRLPFDGGAHLPKELLYERIASGCPQGGPVG